MIVRHATRQQLEKALSILNRKYNNNIIWNNYEQKGKAFVITLRVRDSHGMGSRLGFTGRHLVSACWHVHGEFYDILFALNHKTTIQTSRMTMRSKTDNWQDWNIGSYVQPLMYSEACECNLAERQRLTEERERRIPEKVEF